MGFGQLLETNFVSRGNSETVAGAQRRMRDRGGATGDDSRTRARSLEWVPANRAITPHAVIQILKRLPVLKPCSDVRSIRGPFEPARQRADMRSDDDPRRSCFIAGLIDASTTFRTPANRSSVGDVVQTGDAEIIRIQ